MTGPLHLTQENFENEVLKSSVPVVVDFWAEWCRPCLMMAPILEELSDHFNDQIKIAKLNVDTAPHTAAQYQIRGIPTLLFFENGQVIDQVVGVVPTDELKQKIQNFLTK
ncbi:thioredoxin [bacterium]|nr:thioredoxin [bacterium]